MLAGAGVDLSSSVVLLQTRLAKNKHRSPACMHTAGDASNHLCGDGTQVWLWGQHIASSKGGRYMRQPTFLSFSMRGEGGVGGLAGREGGAGSWEFGGVSGA